MDPHNVVIKLTDGHNSKDRCKDCKKYRNQHFFLHCYDTIKWVEFLHDPKAAENPFMTELHPKRKDERRLLYDGQPPIKLTIVSSTCYPHFIILFIDAHFGKTLRQACTVWTIKP